MTSWSVGRQGRVLVGVPAPRLPPGRLEAKKAKPITTATTVPASAPQAKVRPRGVTEPTRYRRRTATWVARPACSRREPGPLGRLEGQPLRLAEQFRLLRLEFLTRD